MSEQNRVSDKRNGSVLVSSVLHQEMDRDESILVFGEDVAALGGVFGATRQLARTFGSERVFDTPISESAFVGMAVGAAQAGLRPVVELMFADFVGVCFDQIANQMAKNHYMSGREVKVPMVLRTAAGCIGSAAQHSQVLSGTFAHIPGLKVLFPATPSDLQSMLVTAIRDDDPVIFIEHKNLLRNRVEALPYNDVSPPGTVIEPSELGKVRRLKDGTDITVIASGWMVQEAIAAAHALAAESVSVGVIDLRSLVPLDRDGLAEQASQCDRILVVDEDYLHYGLSGEVIASITERLGSRSPTMARLGPTVPVPASHVLEKQVVPDTPSITAAIHQLLEQT